MARAMRPEIHEVKPNSQSECLAEDAPATEGTAAPANAAADARAACATCACAATASAKMRGGATQPAAEAAVPAAARRVETPGPAERRIQRLMDGNKRFVEGEADNDVWTRALTRGDVSPVSAPRTTTPLAVVIACADTDGAPAPDALFDARPGELLVIPAGADDVTEDAVVATARDTVQQYEIPLIIVLGAGHRQPAALPTADSAVAARQASLKIGRESAERDANAAPQSAPADRLVASDASLGARVAARRLTIVAASYKEANGQVSLDLGSDAADAASTPSVPEQVVQLSQD
jgi:carbonic anhydrase